MRMKANIFEELRRQFVKKFQWMKITHSIQRRPNHGRGRRPLKSSKEAAEVAVEDKIEAAKIVDKTEAKADVEIDVRLTSLTALSEQVQWTTCLATLFRLSFEIVY